MYENGISHGLQIRAIGDYRANKIYSILLQYGVRESQLSIAPSVWGQVDENGESTNATFLDIYSTNPNFVPKEKINNSEPKMLLDK